MRFPAGERKKESPQKCGMKIMLHKLTVSLVITAFISWMPLAGIPGSPVNCLAADTGDSGADDSSGDAGGDTGDTGAEEEGGDPSGETDGDPGADDPADEDPAGEDPADEDAVDEDPADEDPEEDEAPEDGTDGGEGSDENYDDIEDDSDVVEEFEEADVMLETGERVPASHVALDGLARGGKPQARLRYFGLLEDWSVLDETAGSQSSLNQRPRTGQDATEDELLLPPSRLPIYTPGDMFIYSNGVWEKVVEVRKSGIEWVNYRGYRSLSSPDFTYKSRQWETRTRKGTRRFKHTRYLLGSSTTTLWPLVNDSKTRFEEYGSWIGQEKIDRIYDSFWRCDVEGAENVSVAIGSYDTWRIVCARYADSFSYPKSGAREYITWNYAPELQHWVQRQRDFKGSRPDRNRQLVAILPDLVQLVGSPQSIMQIQQQFQTVLETYQPGKKDLWMSADGEVSVMISPRNTFVRDDGTVCRQYVQQVQSSFSNKMYAGIGCRGIDGRWYVPRR